MPGHYECEAITTYIFSSLCHLDHLGTSETHGRVANMITLDAGPDDALAVVLLVLLASGYYLSKHLSNPIDIPDQYWYEVPQQSSSACVSREKRAESRDICITWKQKVRDS